MVKISKTIKELVNNRGFYGFLVLDFEYTSNKGLFNFKYDDERYKAILEFAFEYCSNIIYNTKKQNININVVDIDFNIVDSSSILFFYIFCELIKNATDINMFVEFDFQKALVNIQH